MKLILELFGLLFLQDVVLTRSTNRLSELKPPTLTENEFERMIKKLDVYTELQQQIIGPRVSSRRAFAPSEPINIDEVIDETPDQLPYLFEGDMLMTDEQMDALIEDAKSAVSHSTIRLKRSMILGEKHRWKKMPIKYYINTTTKVNEKAVLNGVKLWEKETCITFVRITDKDLEATRQKRKNKYEECLNKTGSENATTKKVPTKKKCKLSTSKPYSIEFIKGKGCYSYVGNISRNGQTISIGNGCTSIGTVSHEMGHALGFYHEQSRPDRDDYIKVATENVVRNYVGQFSKRSWKGVESYGVPYDFGSVMHYGTSAFKNGKNLKTILTKDPIYQTTIGSQRKIGPSFNDVKKANLAYCSKVCKTPLPCENSGYPDPKDCSKCRCPDGFGGKLCNTAATTKSKCGGTILNATDKFQKISQKGQAECNYMIKAPLGKVIHFELTSACFTERQACRDDFIEIKYLEDLGKVGARLCGYYPKATASETNTIMVIYKGSKNSSFQLMYKSHDPLEKIVPYSKNKVVNKCGSKKATTSKTTAKPLKSPNFRLLERPTSVQEKKTIKEKSLTQKKSSVSIDDKGNIPPAARNIRKDSGDEEGGDLWELLKKSNIV